MNLNNILTILVQSKLQKDNNALYQVISQLISEINELEQRVKKLEP